MKQLLREGEASSEYYYTDLVDVVVCDEPGGLGDVPSSNENSQTPPIVKSDWVVLSHKCATILTYPWVAKQ